MLPRLQRSQSPKAPNLLWARRDRHQAKPPGATHLQLFRNVGVRAGIDVRSVSFVGAYTRQNIQVRYLPEQAGLAASYIARWANAKGEAGPWGPGTAMTIAFGGPVAVMAAA